MKRKNFLVLLAAGCLFSCQQQDELQETSKEATNFSISIDDALSDPLTRTSSDLFPAKNSITTGEVISMAASGQNYTPFIVGQDSRTWSEIGATTSTVTFYAHYPALTDGAATRSSGNKRLLKGGQEHLFGTAEAVPGSRNVSLKFKRMTVPVIILDENDNPYEGEAKVELSLKNEGTQDLLNGIIEVNENALSENIEVKKASEGAVTNVLPQKINAGEEIGTITIGGVVQKISAVEDLDLKAGSTLSVRLSRRIGGGIIDGNVPLYR